MFVADTVRGVFEVARGFSLKNYGDEAEQTLYDSLIAPELAVYEEFWQLFVFPFRLPDSIWINTDLAPHHEAICIYNYSILRALARAFELLQRARQNKDGGKDVGSELFYDFCLWTTITYDRWRQLSGALHIYLNNSTDTGRRSLKDWDRDAAAIKDFVGPTLLKAIEQRRTNTNEYRNFIAHGPKFPGGLDRVPAPGHMKELIYWSDWAKAAKDRTKWEAATIDRFELMRSLWAPAAESMNEFWKAVVDKTLADRGDQPYPDHAKVHLPNAIPNPFRFGSIAQPEVPPSGSAFPTIPSGTTFPPDCR